MSFSDEFALEVWGFGRASVIVGSAERAKGVMQELLRVLEQRKDSRAKIRQTAHLVWDLSAPMPKEWSESFERLAKRTGVSLFLCRSDQGISRKESAPLSPEGVPQLA